MPPSALVLFDIDGTLVRKAGPHHRQALEAAAKRATGIAVTSQGVPTQGMLDRDILRAMLETQGASAKVIRDAMPAMIRLAENNYARRCPADLSGKVCPGAKMLLWKLHRKGVPTGLVTGNFTRIGWKKLERAGLRHYLHCGAFAELADDRAGLVRIAMREARSRGWLRRDTLVSLIGDHPNDIRAAKANGVRSIAVCTGVVGEDELRTHAPDMLIPDLRSLPPERLLEA